MAYKHISVPDFTTTALAKKRGEDLRPVTVRNARLYSVYTTTGKRGMFVPWWAYTEKWQRIRNEVAAVQTRRPDALATGRTAAFLLGLPVKAPDTLEFAVPHNRGAIRHPGISTRRFKETSSFNRYQVNFHCWGGILAVLSGELELPGLVACMDTILGTWHGDPELTHAQLATQLQKLTSFHKRKQALAALKLARENVGSPKETELRLSIRSDGLPEPEVAPPVYIPELKLEFHPDLAYTKAKLALEYEGNHHFEMTDQYYQDIQRYYLLQNLGWTVIRVTAQHSLRWVNDQIRLHLGIPRT